MRRLLLLTISTLTASGALADELAQLPLIEKSASLAVLQDQLGNICPGVAADHAMRMLMENGVRAQSPERWAKAYREATATLVATLAKEAERTLLCTVALDFYGPKGIYAERLLKPFE